MTPLARHCQIAYASVMAVRNEQLAKMKANCEECHKPMSAEGGKRYCDDCLMVTKVCRCGTRYETLRGHKGKKTCGDISCRQYRENRSAPGGWRKEAGLYTRGRS